MCSSAAQKQSTAIPMTAGILALIQHVLLTRDRAANWLKIECSFARGVPQALGEACHHAFFTDCAELAQREGVPLDDQALKTIMAMNMDDDVLRGVRNAPAPSLPTLFAFDPGVGRNDGGIVALVGAEKVAALAYRGEIRDWLVADALCEAQGDPVAVAKLEQDSDGVAYQIEVKRSGEQLYAMYSRFGVEVASVILEVNKGVPALHIGDGFDIGMHVHFAHGGAVVTPDRPERSFAPAPVDRYSYDGDDARLLPLQYETLADHRTAIFDLLLEDYDFCGGVIDCGGAVTQSSGTDQPATWEATVNVEYEDGDAGRVLFKVCFAPGAAIPTDVAALDLDTGAEVGSAA